MPTPLLLAATRAVPNIGATHAVTPQKQKAASTYYVAVHTKQKAGASSFTSFFVDKPM